MSPQLLQIAECLNEANAREIKIAQCLAESLKRIQELEQFKTEAGQQAEEAEKKFNANVCDLSEQLAKSRKESSITVQGLSEQIIVEREQFSAELDRTVNQVIKINEQANINLAKQMEPMVAIPAELAAIKAELAVPAAQAEAPKSFNPRGAYEPGEKYQPFDYVSSNGSSYIALVENPTQPPSKKSKQWMLVAARGAGGGGDSSGGGTSNAGDKYLTSSTTSLTLSNGAKTLTVATGLAYSPTQDVTIANDAAHHMHASVTSYNSTTGVLVVDVKQHTGSGTYAVWTVNVGGISSAVIPTGGTTGQVLSKASEANYDTVWSTLGNAATRDVGQAAGNLLELSSANQITIGDGSAPSGSIIMTGLDGSVSISNDNGQLSFTDSEAGSILLNQIVVNNNVENNLVIGIDVNENPYLQGYSEVGLTSGSLLGFDETGGAKIVGNVNFSSGMVVFGTGASIPLSSNSSYMLATGSTGENAGFTANREDDTAFASFDMLEGASGSTGWSVQMAPGDNDLHIVDRVNSVDAITIVSGGNVGIGTNTPSVKLHVDGDVKAVSIITTPVAIAGLPASPVSGQRSIVNDALAPVFLATVVSGGSVICPVFYNGSAWKVG
jgi:hypothetical protein